MISLNIQNKLHKRLLFVLLALGIVAGLVVCATAEVEWPTEIAYFEQASPVLTESVAYGTQEADLNLPKTLRAVVPLDDTQGGQDTFVQAEPGADGNTSADANAATEENTKASPDANTATDKSGNGRQNSYGYLAPENARELFAAGEKVIYTLHSPDGNGGDSVSYRVYGSIGGSENVWLVCDETGNITGAVRDIPVTWEDTGYHPDKPGQYTFVAQAEGYAYSGTSPKASIVVNGPASTDSGKPVPPPAPNEGTDAKDPTEGKPVPKPPSGGEAQAGDGTGGQQDRKSVEATAGGLSFQVSGSLPKNAALSAQEETLSEKEAAELLQDVLPENTKLGKYRAFDISIQADGKKWQPSESLKVAVDSGIFDGEDVGNIRVAHLRGSGSKGGGDDAAGDSKDSGAAAANGNNESDTNAANGSHRSDANAAGVASVGNSLDNPAATVEAVASSIAGDKLVFEADGFSEYIFYTADSKLATPNLGPANINYIGNIKVRKLSQDPKNAITGPTGVIQLPGGRIPGRIDGGHGFISISNLKKGGILGHCKYLNALSVNGVSYDMEVQATSLVDMNGTFSAVLDLNHDYGRVYLNVGVSGISHQPGAVPIMDTKVTFYYVGTNTKATIPSLAIGNTNWTGPNRESFRFEDTGYYLYSTTPEKFTYDTASQTWQSTVYFDWNTYWPTLWTYFTNRSTYTFQLCNVMGEVNFSGNGLEATMGTIPTPPQNTSVSVEKQVIDPSKTFTGSKSFTYNVQPCNASGVATGTGDHAVAVPSKTQACKTGSTTVSGFGNCSFEVVGTYYNLITEKGGTESNWTYDNTRYLQTIQISQDKETLALRQKVTYKNLNTGAAVTKPVFTNRYYGPVSTSVSVRKNVADKSGTFKSGNFTFKAQSCNAGGTVNSDHAVGTPAKTQSCANGTTVSGFGTCTFTSPGTYYNLITETAGSEGNWGYDATRLLQTIVVTKNGSTGKLGAAITYKNLSTGVAVSTPTFTNTFYGPASTSVSVVKKVADTSGTFKSESFTFRTQACNASGAATTDHAVGTPAKTQSCTNGTTVSGFGTCTFTSPGTYYNLITETAGSGGNWVYDTTKYLQAIVVAKNTTTGKLGAAITYKNLKTGAAVSMSTFTNTFYGPASTSVSVVKKVADTSGTFKSGSFTFRTQACNASGAATTDHAVGTPAKTQSCTNGTTVSGFGTCTFTSPGTYYNLITETAGSEGNWAYDTTKYLQTIVVAKNTTTGKLGAAITYKNLKTGAAVSMPTFTNMFYGPAGTSVSVVKRVADTSGTFKGKDFTFSAQPCTAAGAAASTHTVSAPTKTQSCTNGTTVSGFGTCSFPLPGIYYNLITETAGSEGNWVYDTTKYLQTIAVTKNTTAGKLEAAVTYKNLATGAAATQPVFTNTFYGAAATSVSVKKNITDDSLDGSFTGESFTFQVQPCNAGGAVTADHAVGTPSKAQPCVDGTMVSGFGTCSFPLPGTYYNLITETAGGGGGWSYDKTKYLQTAVVVKDGAAGRMAAAVTYKNLATGAAVATPAFTNTYYGTKAEIQVKKAVSNYDASMGGQPFMVSLKGGVAAQLTLKNNETSKPLLLELAGTAAFDISEAVPMEYGLTGITLTNSGKGPPTKLTLTKAADGTITGGRVTISPGNRVLITVTNRFGHKGYFKGRSQAENVFGK